VLNFLSDSKERQMATADLPRRKSPRAPSIPLEEALERVMKVYEKERLHPTPADVVAQDMGYKDANNGRALSAIASLRYYGLIERRGDSLLSVSKDVEAFKYAPNEDLRASYLRRFLTSPPLFGELLDRFSEGLPSDGNLRYELIQRGFLPATAEILVAVLKRSAEFAKAFDGPRELPTEAVSESVEPLDEPREQVASAPARLQPTAGASSEATVAGPKLPDEVGFDRIPVRLSGGRRAWLVVPGLFYEADKQRLKAQIDLLLTEDEEAL
jgi:hypothetical protein